MEFTPLQEYLDSLRPYTGVVWISPISAKFAEGAYWATQNYRAVTHQTDGETPRLSVTLNDTPFEGVVEPLGEACLTVRVARETTTYIIILERRPEGTSVQQGLEKDWSIAAAGHTTLIGPIGSNVHAASKLLLDPALSLRPKR